MHDGLTVKTDQINLARHQLRIAKHVLDQFGMRPQEHRFGR